MEKKLGTEPAFPSPTGNPIQDGHVTVRDYFTAHVLMGDMAAQDEVNIGYITTEHDALVIAKKCYLLADAMLKARNV